MLKKLWFQTHWLLGISAGLVLALMGATGAMLSFEDEILRALNSGIVTVPPQAGKPLAPPELLKQIAGQNPGRRIGNLRVSANPTTAARVGLAPVEKSGDPDVAAKASSGKPARVHLEFNYVDPYTGALLGRENDLRGHAFLHMMEDLHRRLASGDIGRAVTGACSLMLLAISLSGLYLRWPRNRTSLRAWFRINFRLSGRPFLRNLHAVAGTAALPLYLIAVLSGLFFAYDWYRDGVYRLAGVTPPAQQSLGSGVVPAPDLGAAWSVFLRETRQGGYSQATLNLPSTPDQALQFSYLVADPPHDRASNRLSLDLASGEVRAHERYADRTPGGKLVWSMFPIHSGAIFGLPGRILTLLAALTLPVFAVTGWMMYLARRRIKRKAPLAGIAMPVPALEPSPE
jgi:sulfite reductase (NADPH) flavoprotein alpha-component